MERVTDEEAAENGWFWNEQVGSYRPAGAMYCRECKVSNGTFHQLEFSSSLQGIWRGLINTMFINAFSVGTSL